MNIRAFYFALALIPTMAMAQSPAPEPAAASKPINAATHAVLLVNRPERFTEEQWLDMMQKPVNRSLYMLRVTQTMLDTLDATQLDSRFRYEMVQEHGIRPGRPAH